MIEQFLLLCKDLNVPVAIEKTEWANTLMVFLGILLDGRHKTLSIPLDKQRKALALLNDLSGKKKTTIKQLQVLTGYLNFLMKAIFPGRTFTRRMYAKFAKLQATGLKAYHHVRIDDEFHFDCEIWRIFLSNYQSVTVCRLMLDLEAAVVTAKELFFYSDASANQSLGFGAIFRNKWIFAQWENGFIKTTIPA